MAKAKNTNYTLLSKETGATVGFLRIASGRLADYKAKTIKRFDRTAKNPTTGKPGAHVECTIKEIKKGGTKAHARK